MNSSVTVVGSVNADLIAAVPKRGGAGETVLATAFTRRAGGKGANQAAAAARTGMATRLIAAVGDDADGEQQCAELELEGVDITDVLTAGDAPTGLALIVVTPDGENSITVIPGANRTLDASTVLPLLNAAPPPGVVVLQTEVSDSLIEAIAEWCGDHGVRYTLNNGPYLPLPDRVLAGADPLVVNEHEARALCDAVGAAIDPNAMARSVLRATRANSVVVTMGARGAQVVAGETDLLIPAAPTRSIIDTTGAGDSFLGTMAAALAAGRTLTEAVEAASIAAAESVSWEGARPPHVL